MTPNLDATRHHWVGALASYEFSLEYQKGSDNMAADALSRVPIRHDRKTVRSLLEGAVTGITERGEVLISQPLRAECDHLDNEAQVRAPKTCINARYQLGRGTARGCVAGHLSSMVKYEMEHHSPEERCPAEGMHGRTFKL